MRHRRPHPRGRGALAALYVLAVALLAPCLLATAAVIEPRKAASTSVPAPISFAPDQHWEGIDGQWSTFSLRVGTPASWVRVLASTASQQTWTIFKDTAACPDNTNSCYDSRGRTFDNNTSTTWKNKGFYQLWFGKHVNYSGNGLFGYDTVGLGMPGEGGPTLLNTTVGALVSQDIWLGHFGLNAKPTNFSAFQEPSPSYMTYLFQQNLIPSVSFGYTAGAQYRFDSVLGSLTLGGYDSSRFIPNDLTFDLAPNNERDIVVGVVGLSANGPTDNNVNLLSLRKDTFNMYIDSTVAELWLPVEVCQAFEQTFGLRFNNETELYMVNDTVHSNLLARNASITFTLGHQSTAGATVNITLPYASFDLTAQPPYSKLKNSTKYFPIRRATKESQFVLGRTFLQESYLIVDWERQNFSISQCNFVYGQTKNIVPILSSSYPKRLLSTQPLSGHVSTGSIIGIAVGCGFAFALIVCGTMGWFWRKRHQRKLAQMKVEIESNAKAAATAAKAEPLRDPDDTPTSPITDPDEGSNVFPKAELPADTPDRPELSTDVKDTDQSSAYEVPSPAVEIENTERQIFEMPGDIPVRQEADGRQLSEKESMMVRERIYNGVDPNGPPEVSPTTEEQPRRPPPILPSEVTLVNRRGFPVSPVTPLTPRTPRDGALLEATDTFFQPPTRTPRDGRFLEAEDTLLSPISPMEGSADTSRRRFSYES